MSNNTITMLIIVTYAVVGVGALAVTSIGAAQITTPTQRLEGFMPTIAIPRYEDHDRLRWFNSDRGNWAKRLFKSACELDNCRVAFTDVDDHNFDHMPKWTKWNDILSFQPTDKAHNEPGTVGGIEFPPSFKPKQDGRTTEDAGKEGKDGRIEGDGVTGSPMPEVAGYIFASIFAVGFVGMLIIGRLVR